MILTLDDGTRREVDDALFVDFVAKHGRIPQPTAADYYCDALKPATRDEYISRCGATQFADVYLPEINKLLTARLAVLLKQ